MSEEMKFPDTLDEFIEQYSFVDKEQMYTNGSELIHTFRVKQWEEHKKQENQELKTQLEELNKNLFFTKNELDMRQKSIDNKLNQQKEFIEYLENCINELKKESMNELQNSISLGIADITKEILSKYKSIIGEN